MKKPTQTQATTGDQSSSGGASGQQTQGGGTNPQDPLGTNVAPIIINQNPIQPSDQPIVIEKTTEESILTEAPVAPVKELPPTPQAVTNTANEDDGSLIIVEETGVNTVAPVQTEQAVAPQIETTISIPEPILASQVTIAQAPIIQTETIDPNMTEKQSLRDLQLNRMDMKNEVTVTEHQEAMLDNLFGGSSLVPAGYPEVETTTTLDETFHEVAKSNKEEAFSNPVDFIESSIRELDLMIDHIVETHRAKLEEAAGYEAEEKKFLELKVGAYADGEKMMKEKAHAEKMKTYFMNQRDHALDTESGAPRESVETTLTSLSVKNSVDKTTRGSKKVATKNTTQQEVEEIAQ